MPNRNLRLNSISRYSKGSPRFVLEEHGHCEVPAGCGGVVLRWTNPFRAIPLEFWLHVNGEVRFALDGKSPSSGRPLVDHGEHVLSFCISGFDSKKGILMFAATSESEYVATKDASKRKKNPIPILSDPDGSWKYTLVEPSDDLWMEAGFDDTGWRHLLLKPLPKPNKEATESYRYRKLVELGAKGLGITSKVPKSDRIWIRKVFRLTVGPKSR